MYVRWDHRRRRLRRIAVGDAIGAAGRQSPAGRPGYIPERNRRAILFMTAAAPGAGDCWKQEQP